MNQMGKMVTKVWNEFKVWNERKFGGDLGRARQAPTLANENRRGSDQGSGYALGDTPGRCIRGWVCPQNGQFHEGCEGPRQARHPLSEFLKTPKDLLERMPSTMTTSPIARARDLSPVRQQTSGLKGSDPGSSLRSLPMSSPDAMRALLAGRCAIPSLPISR